MQVIKKENVAGVDIDNTLLMWDNATVPGDNKIAIEYGGTTVYLTPHHYHVAIVKSWIERGYHVIIWSANGYQHAERARVALGIAEADNIQVMTKMCKHLDDSTNPGSIIGPRVYEDDFLKPVPEPTNSIILPYGQTDGWITVTDQTFLKEVSENYRKRNDV